MKHLFEPKRTVVAAIVAAALAIAVVGVAQASSHPSDGCSNGFGNTEESRTVGPVTVGVEESLTGYHGEERALVCYRLDGLAGEIVGGHVYYSHWIGSDTYGVRCEGDRPGTTVAAVDCYNAVTHTDPSPRPGTAVSGTVGLGAGGTVNVNQSGAEIDHTTITHSVVNPGAGAICGINVAGTCAFQEVTVTAGGAVGTAFVDGTPINLAVPQATVCTNRATPSGYSVASVNLGSSC